MEIISYIAEIGIIFCAAIVGYVFAGYPLLLSILKNFFYKPVRSDKNFLPDINIVISAYNEEKYIEACIKSIFADNYPHEKVRLLIGDDGSSDRTAQIIREIQNELSQIQFFSFGRKGKNGVLNELFAATDTEIIVMIDADSRITEGSLRKVVNIFADESVGAVIGKQTFSRTIDNSSTDGESIYHKYEGFIRKRESDIFTVLSGNGPFYAARKKFLSQLPNNSVCDDFLPLLRVAAEKKRVIYEPDASIVEVRDKQMNYEFPRIVRFTAGGLASIRETPQILNPFFGWSAFILWSHKILRWFAPIFLCGLLIFSLAAVGTILGKFFLSIFSLLILLAFSGWVSEKLGFGVRFLRFAYFFVAMNASMLLGVFRFFDKAPTAQWEKAVV